MIRRPSFASSIWVVALGIAACTGSDTGGGLLTVITPPGTCAPNNPACFIATDQPVGSELTVANSQNLQYSPTLGTLSLDITSPLVDSDGDGVPDVADDCPGTPDWSSCDGDASNDGVFHELFYDPAGTGVFAERSTRDVDVTMTDAPLDVYFLVDGTTTMAEEIAQLQADFLTGTFADPACPDANMGIAGAVGCASTKPAGGVGTFRDYPLTPLATAQSQGLFTHLLDLEEMDITAIERAVLALHTVDNLTEPEGGSQALYALATGNGVGSYFPNRAPCTDPTRWGYPCFRSDALPLVINITDAAMYNGPDPGGATYVNPPFTGGAAAAANVAPLQTFPGLLDSSDAATAVDLGDLSSNSMSIVLSTVGLANSVNSSGMTGCMVCSGSPVGCDGDGPDAVVAFSFGVAPGFFAVVSSNTSVPSVWMPFFNQATGPALAVGDQINCAGATTSNWGFNLIFGAAISAGAQYYLVADGRLPNGDPTATGEGTVAYQLLSDLDPANATWATQPAPIVWTDTETELLSAGVRVASVVSPKDAMTSPSDGLSDALDLAAATNAVDSTGTEWVQQIAHDGTGLGAAIDSILDQAILGTEYDISVVAEDDPGTVVDETALVSFTAASCACAGGPSGNTCGGCVNGEQFQAIMDFENTTIPYSATAQVLNFDVVVYADGSIELGRIPVRILIPPNSTPGTFAPTGGYYENRYDTSANCNAPTERPLWGDLTWSGSSPVDVANDPKIRFEIQTDDDPANLDSATVTSITIPDDTTSNTIDVRQALIDAGVEVGFLNIKIKAVLLPDPTGTITPSFDGWTFEYFCVPAT